MIDDIVYLKDIRDQIDIIISEAETMTFEEFESRPIYRNGMIHSIIIIGEAAKRFSETFKETYPEMPISAIARTRDKLVHGYQGTDYISVWDMIQNDIPELNALVRKILAELE